ncbi:MAG: thioesterase family protein [Pseudomonadota bacterium]
MTVLQPSQIMTHASASVRWRSSPTALKSQWIDHNGHLNMAYYMVIFDLGSDEVFDRVGLGPQYRQRHGLTTYTVQAQICYLQEVKPASTVHTEMTILDVDEKRIHTIQELFADNNTSASATCEMITLSIDPHGPKAAPFPGSVYSKLQTGMKQHRFLKKPAQAGQTLSLSRRSKSQ